MLIDYVTISTKFNELRQTHKKVYSIDEMKSLMKSIGIRSDVFYAMMKKDSFFRVRRNGLKKEITFCDTPIYKEVFRRLFEDCASIYSKKKQKEISASEETKAIVLLKSLGYRILKEDGIDEKRLSKEMPEVFEKYLIIKEM